MCVSAVHQLFIFFIPGAHFHRRLLGQVRRQPWLQAGLPDRDVPGELRGEIHRHHLEHHQPLHADGAEGCSLMMDLWMPAGLYCEMNKKMFCIPKMSVEQNVKKIL